MLVNIVTILIVDDDHKFLEMMKKTLESKDCHVQTASTSSEALSILLNQTIHVAFIDCVLLSEQGIYLVQKIRKYLGFSVDIVMMSGIVSRDGISNFVDRGILDFIKKPISNQSLEKVVIQVKEKLIFGKENHLFKIFDQKVSAGYKLKYVLSLKESTSIDFLLVLVAFLNSKAMGFVTFSTDSKDKHKISFNKGVIVNYVNYDLEYLLNNLIEKEIIFKDESKVFKGMEWDLVMDKLISFCCISSFQVSSIKLDLLEEALKKITMSSSVSFKIELFTLKEEENKFEFSQNDLADFIFNNQDEKSINFFKCLLDEKSLDLSLEFKSDKNDIEDYLPEVRPLVSKLKTGLSLQEISVKDNKFYKSIFYILSKGEVYFLNFKDKGQNNYFYERYKNLSKFFKNQKTKDVFQLLDGGENTKIEGNDKKINHIYRFFMKFNHLDKLPKDLPKDLLALITEVGSQLKDHKDLMIAAKYKKDTDEEEKNKKIETEIYILKKKNICQDFLEKEEYEKASSIIKEIPEKLVEEDINWQIFYVWLGLSLDSNVNYDQKRIKKYLQKFMRDFDMKSKYIYHYILGLYYESEENYQKALLCYENAKLLDPSFKTIYKSIKRVTFINVKKQRGDFSFTKISDFIKSKQKKEG